MRPLTTLNDLIYNLGKILRRIDPK